MYHITNILATSSKLLIIKKRKTKPMVETMTKTTQYMDDIELHFTENEKGHKQENKKISIEIKRM